MGRFRAALARPGLGAIAEVKRRSPSAGDLRPDADPAELAAAFEAAGASAVSVLVDERFAGTWDDLRAARATASLPLLAKGFFVAPADLVEARAHGADAVLLLLRDLEDARVRELMGVATELGLDTLVEAHDAEELARATALAAPVIGLNARDLATFELDRRRQLGLVAAAPRDRIVVAESGIENRAHGAAAGLAGAAAVLVGSALMRAPDPAATLAGLLRRPYVKVCGLTREEDVAVAAMTILGMIGYRAQHVPNAGTALALLLGGERFDLMLSDIVMPGGMSGFELAQKVRQHFPWLPILLSTGYAKPAAEVHQAGFDIIAKPYNAASLLDAITRARQSAMAGESAETA